MLSQKQDKKWKYATLLTITWIALFFLSIYLLYTNSIENVGFSPHQPIVFSHKLHSGDYGIKCLFCHTDAEFSDFSPIPSTYTCMVCHIALKNESELMKQVNLSYDDTMAIVWNRCYKLPDYTHFSHSRHIRAKIDCSSCHDKVETMDTVFQVRPLNMLWCLDCHRNPEANIIPARNISGIFVYPDSDTLLVRANGKPKTIPFFGDYDFDLPIILLKGIPTPKRFGLGSQSCSSCHF
jgi:hypothetical protein